MTKVMGKNRMQSTPNRVTYSDKSVSDGSVDPVEKNNQYIIISEKKDVCNIPSILKTC